MAVSSLAQNVSRVEYFVDTDPGFGNGAAVTITPGQDVTANFQFDISSLSVGFHNLYIRSYVNPYPITENGNPVTKGGWSLANVRNFYKENLTNIGGTLPNITGGEYFIDTDPGFGNGSPIPVTPGTDISTLNFTFDATALTTGFHNLYVRFRDVNGAWSHGNVRNFYKEAVFSTGDVLSNITQGEYFVDTDPGFGNGANIPVVAATDINNQSFTFDITSLPAGFHNLYVRFKNANGHWSHAYLRNFYKENLNVAIDALPNITGGEYFIGADPGHGSGTPISVVPGTDISNQSFTADVTNFPTGFHTLSLRFKDANGHWGHSNHRNFYKESLSFANTPLANIVNLEYFINTDPGFGNGKPVPLNPATDINSFAFPVDMTNISIGNHRIYVRAQDASGKWSLVHSGTFVVEPPAAIYITVGDVAGNTCAGSALAVPFAVNMPYGSNNIFTAQLSNGSGSFVNPVNIGTLTGSNSDTIRATIPSNTTIGNAYRVRILASSPLDTSAAGSTAILMKRVPEQQFVINGKSQTCLATEIYTASAVDPNITYTWTLSGGGTIDTAGAAATITWTTAGTYTLTLTPSNNCGSGLARTLSVIVYAAAPSAAPIITVNNRTLSASAPNAGTANGYQWYRNDTLIVGAINSSYYAAVDENYKAAYTNTCGIGPASAPLTVATLQSQTISFDSIPDKVYGNAPFTINATASSGLPVTFQIISGPATISADSVYLTGAGIVTIRATQVGNSSYSTAIANRTFTVQKAIATVVLSNLGYVYDGLPKTPSSTTNPTGLQVNYFYNGSTAIPVNAGTYYVSATINDANYTGTATDTLRVEKANQQITLVATTDKEYGSPAFTVQASSSSTLPVVLAIQTNPSGCATLSGNIITIHNIGAVIVNTAQPGNSNYNAAPEISDTFNITKANQLISIVPLPDVTIDRSMVTINAIVSSGLPLSYSITTNPPTRVATSAGNVIDILGDTGTVIIKVSQAGNQFYNATEAQRTFRVLGREQFISFSALPDKTFGDAPVVLNATASSTLPVHFTVVNGSAYITGNILTIAGAGTITIEANQPGNDSIRAAIPARQSFNVAKAVQTIAIDAIPNKSYGDIPFTISAQANSGLPVHFSIVSGYAYLSGNTITITGGGNVTVRASQNGNQTYLPATAEQTFCVAPKKPLKIYGFTQSCISTQQYSIDTIPGISYTWTISNGETLISNVGSKVNVSWNNTGTHQLFVKAVNLCDPSAADTTGLTVQVINLGVPPEVTNLFPVDSTIVTGFPLSLSWQASGTSQLYDVYIWPAGSTQPVNPYAANLTAVAMVIYYGNQLPGFAPGVKYQWKVVTKNACQQSSGVSGNFIISKLPNLVLQSVQAPDTTFSGKAIDITIKVLNNGSAATRTTRWSDAVYLSRDTVLDTQFDVYIGGSSNLSALDSGQQYIHTFRVNLPQNTIGDYHLFVITNAFNSLTEVTRLDDTIVKPILINLTPAADLQVTSVVTPADAFSAQRIPVTYTVKNKGGGKTDKHAWVDYIYISPDPVFDRTTAVKIEEIGHGGTLLPDSSYTFTVSSLLPSRFFGKYYIFVETDVKNEVFEFTFENNNTNRNDSIQIFLTPPPDYVVSEFNSPATVSSQEISSFDYKVYNNGANKPTVPERSWRDGIYISRDSVFNIGSAKLLNYTLPLLRDSIIPVCSVPIDTTFHGTPFNEITPTLFSYYESISWRLITIASGCSNGSCWTSVIRVNIFLQWHSEVKSYYSYLNSFYSSYFNSNNITPSEGYCSSNMSGNIQAYNGTNYYEGYYIGADYCGQVMRLYPRMIPEETYINKISAMMPDSLEGTYYLHLYTDMSNAVFEFQKENNNTKARTVQVLNPDLTINAIDIPDTVNSGANVSLSWKVKNTGQGKVVDKTRKDFIWLSSSPVYNTANMIRIDSLNYCSAIDSGASITKQKVIHIPDGLTGTYYLFIETDKTKTIYEGTHESNNYLYKQINIQLTPWPDLRIDTVQLSKDSVESEEGFIVSYQVSNKGVAPITGKTWKDIIYITKGSVLDTSSTYIAAEVFRAQSLDTNTFYTIHQSVSIPAGINTPSNADSGYYVHVYTDGNKNVFENNAEHNNIKKSGKLYLKEVDLAVTNVTGPVSVFSGQNATLSWQVQNKGGKLGRHPLQWKDKVFLSADTIPDAGDLVLLTQYVNGPIVSNGTYNRSVNYQMPNGYSGNYYLLVKADCDEEISDKNRANNVNTLRASNGVPIPISITFTPPPDLIVNALEVPAIGHTGQPITIKWQVKNIGTGSTLTGGWKEMVYLTTNPNPQQNNRIDGIHIGSYTRSGNLAKDSAYADSLRVFVPMIPNGNCYLYFTTDFPSQVYEHNSENNNGAIRPVFIIKPQPADLIVTSIVSPAQALAGDTFTVSWKVGNIGINPADGYFTQGIYLSKDSSWSVDDVLINNSDTSVFMSPADTILFTKNVRATGAKDGKYFVIIRTDLTNNIVETNENNNTGISEESLAISILNLPLNVVTPHPLLSKTALYYKLHIPDSLQGETILISLKSYLPLTPNELYVKLGDVPSRASFDYGYEVANSSNQDVVIPSAVAGNYYILAYNNSGTSQSDITLLAQKISFSVMSVNTNEGGNTGLVTTKLRGSKFGPGMQISLQSNTLGSITATTVQYVNSTTVFATFNLAGKSIGQYNVIAKKANDDTTSLSNGFRVLQGSGGGFQGGGVTSGGFYCTVRNIGVDELIGFNVQSPEQVRIMQYFTNNINFGNSGNVDVPVPGRLLVSVSGAPIALTPQGLAEGKTELYLEFKEPNGPEGILRPGATGSITIYTRGYRIGNQTYRLIE